MAWTTASRYRSQSLPKPAKGLEGEQRRYAGQRESSEENKPAPVHGVRDRAAEQAEDQHRDEREPQGANRER
jgi:hypothetical protein